MLLRRFTDSLRAQDWMTVLVEFVLLVTGIYVGIEVSNWNEARLEREQERVYLVELQEDFRSNLEALERNESNLVGLIEDMLYLLRLPDRVQEEGGPPMPPAAELVGRFAGLQRMPTFTNDSRTWDFLIGSGDLGLISDRRIQEGLASYQRLAGLIALVQQTHEAQLVETFQPFIIEHLDYVALALDRLDGELPLPPADDADGGVTELLDDRLFRNVLVQKWVICADLLEQTRDLQEATRRVLDALQDALDTRTVRGS